MRSALLITSLILGLLKLGCCPSKTAERAVESAPADAAAVRPAPPNVIQQNLALVEGTVDSVLLAGPTDYRLSLFIRSSGTQANGFAAQGEHVTVAPQFQLTDTGALDTASARNAGLLKLRGAKAGEVIRAKISLTPEGRWVILEAHDH